MMWKILLLLAAADVPLYVYDHRFGAAAFFLIILISFIMLVWRSPRDL